MCACVRECVCLWESDLHHSEQGVWIALKELSECNSFYPGTVYTCTCEMRREGGGGKRERGDGQRREGNGDRKEGGVR